MFFQSILRVERDLAPSFLSGTADKLFIQEQVYFLPHAPLSLRSAHYFLPFLLPSENYYSVIFDTEADISKTCF